MDTLKQYYNAFVEHPIINGLLPHLLTVVGFLLAFYLPATPLILWMINIVGWFIQSVKMMFALPIFFVAHAIPEGDGFAGQYARRGYFLMIGTVLRPLLLVVGMMAGSVVIAIVGWLQRFIMPIMFASMDITNLPGFFGFVALMLIYAGLMVTLVLVPAVPGALEVRRLSVAFNVTLFALISTVLIHTFGSFRERMDALRIYCKVVERGEAAALPQLGAEKWPDELTLLARTFQAMHVRLAEQIGSDPLTGCLNRRSLEAKLRADLRQARRRGSTISDITNGCSSRMARCSGVRSSGCSSIPTCRCRKISSVRPRCC